MTAIGKGDWVECIKAGSPDGFTITAGDRIVVGVLYQVRAITRGMFANGRLGEGLFLHGVKAFGSNGREGAWAVHCFRPIYRRDESLTHRLMEPVSDRTPPGVSRKSRQDQPAHDEPVSSLREVA